MFHDFSQHVMPPSFSQCDSIADMGSNIDQSTMWHPFLQAKQSLATMKLDHPSCMLQREIALK
jgi:hypothetical protein